MFKTQREWITPAAVPLQRFYGVVVVSQKYQNLKKSETATLSQVDTCKLLKQQRIITVKFTFVESQPGLQKKMIVFANLFQIKYNTRQMNTVYLCHLYLDTWNPHPLIVSSSPPLPLFWYFWIHHWYIYVTCILTIWNPHPSSLLPPPSFRPLPTLTLSLPRPPEH